MRAPTNATNEPDNVRANTSPAVLRKIDCTIEERVQFYTTQPKQVVSRRIEELEREWDMERWLETNASSLALGSLILGLTVSKKYLLITTGVLGFLLTHAVRGWCPPVPALRRLGVRTKSEIDRERFALKILRGDFQNISTNPKELKTNSTAAVLDAIQT